MWLLHSLSDLQPQARFAMVSEEQFRWSRPWSFMAGAEQMVLSAQAGLMLGHHSHDNMMEPFAAACY